MTPKPQNEQLQMQDNVLMKLEKVTKTYPMGQVTVEALKNASLEIYRGEVMVILGPSGSGKSTLLHIMGGMDLPTSGRVVFDSHDLSRADKLQLTHFRRNEVGFVFQFFNLVPDLTALENIELAASLVDAPLSADEIIRTIELEGIKDSFPSRMSGGEQQRVAIARAIAKNPRLLLCDEPTGSLDFEAGKLVLSLLARVNKERGAAVVIVTHNTAIAAMADRVVRMRSGMIVEITQNIDPVKPENIEW